MEDEEECTRCTLCGQEFGANDKVTRLVAVSRIECGGGQAKVQCRQI